MKVASLILRDAVFEEVRTKRNLSYAPDAFLSSQGVNTGGLYFTAVDANLTVAVMLGEIARLQKDEVPAGLIRSTSQGLLTTSFLEQETNPAQASALALHELIGGGWRQAGQMLERVRAVTPADVRASPTPTCASAVRRARQPQSTIGRCSRAILRWRGGDVAASARTRSTWSTDSGALTATANKRSHAIRARRRPCCDHAGHCAALGLRTVYVGTFGNDDTADCRRGTGVARRRHHAGAVGRCPPLCASSWSTSGTPAADLRASAILP